MESEVFVMNLVKASTKAQILIANMLGPYVTPNRFELPRRLRRTNTLEQLAAQLECRQDQVFDRLADRLKQTTRNRRPPIFTVNHLDQLKNPQACKRVASALACRPQEVLDRLFDSHAIFDTLFTIEPEILLQRILSESRRDSLIPSSNEIFPLVLDLREKVAAHLRINDFDWGDVLDEYHWLRRSAVERLGTSAMKLGFSLDMGPNMLAAVIEEDSYNHGDDRVHFGALAIIHIQQRINWIIQQMRDQIQELSEEVKAKVPLHSFLAHLQPRIEYYELKAPAHAWRLFLNLEDIQSTRLIPSDLSRHKLGTACTQLQPALIQALILAGIDLPGGVSSTWDHDLSYQRPITSVIPNQDTFFPMSRADILNLMQEEYAQTENLRLIE